MKFRDLMLLMVVCLVWAFNFVSGAKGMQQFSPLMFMIMRFSLLLTLTLPFLRMPPVGQWPRMAAAALLIGSIHFSFLFWALKRSGDVSSVAIVQQMYVPIAVLLAVILLGESIGLRRVLAIGMAFAGVLILGFDPHVLSQPDALVLALLSAFFQALGSIFLRGIVGFSPMKFQAWTAILSLPLLISLSFFLDSGQIESIRSAQPLHWASVAFSAIGASIVGHGLFYYMAQRHPISTIMPYMLMMPVFAVIFGVLVWGDRPGWRLLLGGSLVLLGILVITLRTRRTVEKILR
ncbi:MAG: DMT family transporter [Lysobacterales bacterium]